MSANSEAGNEAGPEAQPDSDFVYISSAHVPATFATANNTRRFNYILEVLGSDAAKFDMDVVRRCADGIHGGLSVSEADQFKRIAQTLANNNVVISRIGRSSTLAKIIRSYK